MVVVVGTKEVKAVGVELGDFVDDDDANDDDDDETGERLNTGESTPSSSPSSSTTTTPPPPIDTCESSLTFLLPASSNFVFSLSPHRLAFSGKSPVLHELK